ncbi:MAG: hypothetical protein KJO64_04015, partial [Bacteroidia bacterium]|nr:hypothetical protein [Bacteroidia bacterium]
MNSNGKNNSPLHEEIDVVGIFYEVLSKWYYYVGALILCLGIAFVFIKLTLPEYQAHSTILIKESEKSANNISNIIAGEMYGVQRNLTTEIGIIKSRAIIEETIDRLNLEVSFFNLIGTPPYPIYNEPPVSVKQYKVSDDFRDVDFGVRIINDNEYELEINNDTKSLPDYYYKESHKFGERVKTNQFELVLDRIDSTLVTDLNDEIYVVFRKKKKLINSIIERLQVTPYNKDADIIQLYFTDYNPARAADVLNTIGDVYIDKNIEDKASIASLTLHFVDDQLDNITGVLNGIEADLQNFKEKNGTVNLSEESNAMLDRLNQVDIDILKTEIELKSLNNLETYINDNKDLNQLAPSTLGINDPLLLKLIQNFGDLQADRKSLSFGVSDDIPSVQIIDQQIADTKNSIIDNIQSIKKQLETTLKAYRTR